MRLLARPDVEKLCCATGGPLSPMLLLPSLQASPCAVCPEAWEGRRGLCLERRIFSSLDQYPCIQHGKDGPRPPNVTDEMLKCGA